MKINHLIKKGIQFLQNQEVDLTTRMLFLLEYAALFASIIGTIVMAASTSSVYVLIPNFILILCCVVGLYFTHAKKKYNLAITIFVCGGDYVSLTYMFFTSGGNKSGMPMWFLFAVAFTCLMVKGKLKIILSSVSVLISCACMLIAEFHPELVKDLENSQAVFMDVFQSFIIVSVILCASLMLYLDSYDKQRKMLEQKSLELKKAINTDIMTGISNRHAFYEDSVEYADKGYKENLVFVSLDLNGLKSVNDNEGHAEGDIFIQSAARVISETFIKFGSIYRIGGDEFVAILFCTDEEADNLKYSLEKQTEIYNGKNNAHVSMSIGVAVWNRNKEISFAELERKADFDMYRYKNEYYNSLQIDRRRR